MPYSIQVNEVFQVLSLGNPEKPFWGHCTIDGVENGYSCGITFGDADWYSMAGLVLPISFYWDVLPVDCNSKGIDFFSAGVKVLHGTLRVI